MSPLDRILRSFFLSVLVVLFALPAAAHAANDTWQPLDVLTHWRYAVDGGGTVDATITRTMTLLGRNVAVKRYTGGIDDGLEQFWLNDDAGTVLLAGFDLTNDGFALAYDPPIAILQSPPSLGLTWTDDATAYTLPDLSVYATLHIQWAVLEDGALTLPIGSVPAFGVGQVVTASMRSVQPVVDGFGIGVDGRRVVSGATTNDPNTTDWYAMNLGLVQYRASGLYQLSEFDRPDAAAPVSWGRIHRIYR
jgi:hypothetical protein